MSDGIPSFKGGKKPGLSAGYRPLSGTYHILLSTHDSALSIALGKELCMPNQMGKRYMCGKCGVEVIITKAGGGTVVCCGQDMVMKK
jgi:desulfoferrodoxin-like iron-binding protein